MLRSDCSDAQSDYGPRCAHLPQMPISMLCDKIWAATSENLDQPSQSDQNLH